MNVSLGTFFWLSVIYFYIKYNSDPSPYLDAIFLVTVIVFMYFINVTTMNSNCGSTNMGTVLKATLVPWLLIFGLMVLAINIFPGWKSPFSNTFGYIVARLAGGTTVLLKLLKPKGTDETMKYIYNDPSLFINQFTYENFDESIKNIPNLLTTESPAAFKRIIYLKELVAEWVWYMLTASIVITTSYNMIMRTECTKSLDEYVDSHNIAMSSVEASTETPRVYTSTE